VWEMVQAMAQVGETVWGRRQHGQDGAGWEMAQGWCGAGGGAGNGVGKGHLEMVQVRQCGRWCGVGDGMGDGRGRGESKSLTVELSDTPPALSMGMGG